MRYWRENPEEYEAIKRGGGDPHNALSGSGILIMQTPTASAASAKPNDSSESILAFKERERSKILMSEQKERPILFSGEMVRAILDGRKTQTRRTVKPQPIFVEGAGWQSFWALSCDPDEPVFMDSANIEICCPYGVAGDRLWVRETWAAPTCYDDEKPRDLPDTLAEDDQIIYRAESPDYQVKALGSFWRSPYHMPRWASRITLEITKVRVERLQEISEQDAKSEGIHAPMVELSGIPYAEPLPKRWSARLEFRRLWDSINGKGAWDANPWVWVLEFSVASPSDVSTPNAVSVPAKADPLGESSSTQSGASPHPEGG